jgi:hypothetical protein
MHIVKFYLSYFTILSILVKGLFEEKKQLINNDLKICLYSESIFCIYRNWVNN